MSRVPPLNIRTEVPVGRHLGTFLASFGGANQTVIEKIVALLCLRMADGHICLDLDDVRAGTVEAAPDGDLEAQLRLSPTVGEPGDFTPLILDGKRRLYLQRYWEYEARLCRALQTLADAQNPLFGDTGWERTLTGMFLGEDATGSVLLHRILEHAINRGLTIVSGGPGTGKTTTACELIALIASVHPDRLPYVALCAPTGKAAMRLRDAVGGRLSDLQVPRVDADDHVSVRASTIHRLLGSVRDSIYFKYNSENPLPHDLLIVDEGSMLDLALMGKLMDAVDTGRTHVVLLGDCDQLASVEAGSVLGDIARSAEGGSGRRSRSIGSCFYRLQSNWRYDRGSGIHQLVQSIRLGRADDALSLLGNADFPEVVLDRLPSTDDLMATLKPQILGGFLDVVAEDDPIRALGQLSQFRILCAMRRGPYGSERINRIACGVFVHLKDSPGLPEIFSGMPVIIDRNDHAMQLFNGDTGIVAQSSDIEGRERVLSAWFVDGDGAPRSVSISRLPEWSPAFATTVHRGQGSEYERVIIVLPEEDNPVLTRELLYTAVSRARSSVLIYGCEDLLASCIQKRVERNSGLVDHLLKEAG